MVLNTINNSNSQTVPLRFFLRGGVVCTQAKEEGGGYTLKGSNKTPHILGNTATESCNATLINCMYTMETTPSTV